MPLRGASGPGETARATTSPGPTCSTASRGTPSPMTISERCVTSRGKSGKSTSTRSPSDAAPSALTNVMLSPGRTARSIVAALRRSFGPCRSISSATGRAARSAAARTSAARRRSSSCVPCEQFRRAQSRPAAIRRSRTPGASVAGPSVATIFVRRSSIDRTRYASGLVRPVLGGGVGRRGDLGGEGNGGWVGRGARLLAKGGGTLGEHESPDVAHPRRPSAPPAHPAAVQEPRGPRTGPAALHWRAVTESLRLRAGDMTFAALAWGPADGPLALCLHGYPDTAWTWRHLGPYLGERGWRAVAPYTRGYGPTDLAPDGAYQLGALASDAQRLYGELGGDERAVLIGHDWGAATAYVLGAHAPGLFARFVTLAVPPTRALQTAFRSPVAFVRDLGLIGRQLRMSWYMFFGLLPGLSERSLGRLIPKQWADWSPGYDAGEDIAAVFEALATPNRRTAALRYYRALFLPWMRQAEYAAEQARMLDVPSAPLLYLHGEDDGCLQAVLAGRTAPLLGPGSRAEVVPRAGHFLHLERPDDVNRRIAAFVGAA